MGLRAVVAAHGVCFLVQGECTPVHRHRCLEDEHLPFELAVGPIDDDDRAADAGEKQSPHLDVDVEPLAVDVFVTEQSVDGLDVMLGEARTGAMAPEFSEAEPTASEGGVHRSEQGIDTRFVADAAVALKPSFQQAYAVHVVLCDRDGSVVTPIGSDDDMHVDP